LQPLPAGKLCVIPAVATAAELASCRKRVDNFRETWKVESVLIDGVLGVVRLMAHRTSPLNLPDVTYFQRYEDFTKTILS